MVDTHPHSQPKNNSFTAGKSLRKARKDNNLSQEDIAQELMISPLYLDALEKGLRDALPERVFTLGYVKSYSNYLGLDTENILHQFKNHLGKQDKPTYDMPTPQGFGRQASTQTVVAGVAVILIALGLWYGINKNRNDKTTSNIDIVTAPSEFEDTITTQDITPILSDPLPNTITVSADLTEKTTFDVANKGTTAALSASQNNQVATVTITANQPSWVEITRKNGTILYTKVMEAGQSYTVPPEPNLTLVTGNAGGITLSINGKLLPKLGRPAQVIRGVSLDRDTLIQKIQP